MRQNLGWETAGVLASRFGHRSLAADRAIVHTIPRRVRYTGAIRVAVADILKFSFATPHEIASFKINVPVEYFKTLWDPNFWPPHVVVH
ncbi:uncharacterized protein Dmoj_GI27004, partial [Drosophila mojavensis]